MKSSQQNDKQKTVIGVPYDFRKPTVAKYKSRLWNPEDSRLFPPKVFGAGWAINFYWLRHPLSSIKHVHPIKFLVILLSLIIVGLASFFLGDKYGLQSMTFKRVTPDQLASAMKDDHFFTTYRYNTLLVHGTITAISNVNGDSIVEFKTSTSFKTACDFGSTLPNVYQNETITVLSEASVAQRQSSGVLLKGCLIQ